MSANVPADQEVLEEKGRRVGPTPALMAVVALCVMVADQLTKWLALERLEGQRLIELVWTLRLRLVFNRGAAFGVGSRFAPLIAIAVVVVLLWVTTSLRQHPSRIARVALGLVLGGGFGNLSDRLFREGEGFLGGAVVDFIDFQWWPVFNVADSAISVGLVLLVFSLRERK